MLRKLGTLGKLGMSRSGSGIITPQSLFSNGEQGIYLYPQDTTSLFQDAAGTIPATAENDPVGLILDKRPASGVMRLYGGSTTIAAGSGAWPVAVSPDGTSVYVANYGSHNVSIYTRAESGALTSAGTIAAGTGPVSVTISPDGASVYVANRNSDNVSIYSRAESGALTAAGTIAAGTTPYSVAVSPDGTSVYVANYGSDTVSIYTRAEGGALTSAGTIAAGSQPFSLAVSPDGASVYVANNDSNNVSIYSRAESGALTAAGTIAAGNSPRSVTVSPDGASVYVANESSDNVSIYSRAESGALTSSGTITAGNTPRSAAVSPDGASVYTANRSSNTVSIYKRSAGNHAFQATSPKRALLKYTDSGVLSLYYDGVDDCYQTYDIDFSATDEMTVFAGVQKRSTIDGSADSVCELSAAFDSNNGAFAVGAPGISKEFSYITKGTLIGRADDTDTAHAAPYTAVITGESKISTDFCRLSINGTVIESTTLDQGTGNYGNYPLNIGSRNQSSTFFKGFLSALIIRGKSVTPAQKRGIEQWVKSKQR